MNFLFFSRESEKKAKKDTLARRFTLFAGGFACECRRCGVALGHPFVHGDPPGRGCFLAYAMACADGCPHGAPFCFFCLEVEHFRKMAFWRRILGDGVVPAYAPFAFAACVPYT